MSLHLIRLNDFWKAKCTLEKSWPVTTQQKKYAVRLNTSSINQNFIFTPILLKPMQKLLKATMTGAYCMTDSIIIGLSCHISKYGWLRLDLNQRPHGHKSDTITLRYRDGPIVDPIDYKRWMDSNLR